MFHDLGLTDKYRTTDQRFEIDAADVTRSFLSEHDITGEAGDKVWNAIALHTTPEIPLHMDPEVAMVTRGVELDVLSKEWKVHPSVRYLIYRGQRRSES